MFSFACIDKHCNLLADIVDKVVWEWLYEFLANDDALQAGINRMIERNETELTPRCERFGQISKMVEKNTRRIRRLAAAMADLDDDEENHDEASEALKLELKQAGKELNSLKEERARLESQIQQSTLNPEEITLIKKSK